MALTEEGQEQETFPLVFDALFCDEESFGADLGEDIDDLLDNISKKQKFSSSDLKENDLFCEDDELQSLILKEQNVIIALFSDEFLMVARKEALGWIFRSKVRFGFTPFTTVLAVNYFDRFISSLWFQKEKPWMNQLAAVACVSLAAKIEETKVPPLLDLQMEDSKYIFDARTIQRMELLVLSALQWRMHPVTPLSFFHHIARKLGLTAHLQWKFLWDCERLLLSVIDDFRVICHPPSVLASATMLHVIGKINPHYLLDYQNCLMTIMRISKEKLDGCYKLIVELTESKSNRNKRKPISTPNSPNGVIDTTFSWDTSNDSWAAASIFSTSPDRLLKRTRVLDDEQHMELPSFFCSSMDALGGTR